MTRSVATHSLCQDLRNPVAARLLWAQGPSRITGDQLAVFCSAALWRSTLSVQSASKWTTMA
jgi:hypothetical protein